MRERRPDFVMAKDRFYVGPLFCCGGSVALCWRVRIGEIWGLKMTEFHFLIVFFLVLCVARELRLALGCASGSRWETKRD